MSDRKGEQKRQFFAAVNYVENSRLKRKYKYM